MTFIRKNPVLVLVLSLGFLTIHTWLRQMELFDYRLSMIGWVLGIGCFVYSSYLLINDFEFESNYFKYVFYLFLIYEFFIVIRGIYGGNISFKFIDLWALSQNGYLFWPFIIPLFVFFNKKLSNFTLLFEWSFRLGVVTLIIIALFPTIVTNREEAEIVLTGLTFGCGILLFYATYIKEFRINLSFIVILIALFSFTYLARRNNVVTILGFIMFSYILNIRSSNRPMLFKIYPIILVLGTLIVLSYSSITQKIKERISEDTRSELLTPFFIEMDNYAVFGKGLKGTYYYPMSGGLTEEGVTFTEVEFRDIIEVGYLQLFLNGGIIHVVLYLLILLPAAFNGIFRSKNLFSKASGLIILLWLVDMVIYGVPYLSYHYVFIWICVGICYKPSLRLKTEDEIRNEFLKPAII